MLFSLAAMGCFSNRALWEPDALQLAGLGCFSNLMLREPDVLKLAALKYDEMLAEAHAPGTRELASMGFLSVEADAPGTGCSAELAMIGCFQERML